MQNRLKSDIRQQVFHAIKRRGYTYDVVCRAFNMAYKEEIEKRGLRKLNKDLLYRIKKETFSPTNIRVVKLCDFLQIQPHELQKHHSLTQEALLIDDLVKMKPYLKNEIKSFVQNLLVIIEKRDEQNEIY